MILLPYVFAVDLAKSNESFAYSHAFYPSNGSFFVHDEKFSEHFRNEIASAQFFFRVQLNNGIRK